MKYFLILILISLTGISKAANYYVDPSSTSSTQNGSVSSPWKTLSQVQNNMNSFLPGDFIYFKKGQTFSGSLNITRSGTAAAPITFSNYGTDVAKPIFTGSVSTMILVSYVSYVVIDGINIKDMAMNPDNHSAQANIHLAIYIDGSSYITIKNCDISLVGGGVNIQGHHNTIDKSSIQNMRMIVNTPGGDDDYGAIPIIISGSYNNITNNYFKDGWANSYDYGYDGGAIEIYGALNTGNKIMYNTAVNCDGFMEIGYNNGGHSDSNLVAYNKIINCGELVYISNSGSWATSVVNLKIFNNVLVSNANLLRMPTYMIGMSGSSSTPNIINLKNNIFWISSGIDVASGGRFTGTQMTHEDNIYHLGSGSVLNYTAHSTELSTIAALFTNTSSSDPTLWDYSPIAGSPAIDFGQNLGISKDFIGNTVPSIPNAGILESISAQSTLNISSAAGTINCFGGTTSITISATGGVTPYSGIGTFTVTSGTYTYNVTDAAGIVKSVTVTISQPAAIIATATSGTISVNGGNTSITASATGGTSPYNYSINSGAFQASNIFSGILAGTHSITVKDSKGCTSVKSITITQPAASSALAATSTVGTISCNGGTTTVTVSATGGTTPYTGTGTFTKAAGTHSFTVTDATGTIRTISITITQPTTLVAAASAGTISIFGGSTTVTAGASGGTSSYTYNINGGSYQTSTAFSNVGAGTHIITAKDSKGCTNSKTISITQPSQIVPSSSIGTISCNGSSTTVTISATGGTAPYTGIGTYTVYAGTYNYTVNDAAGASKTISVTVSQPTSISATIAAPGVYSNSATTTATVTASGGTPGYTYKLDAGNYQSGNQFSNVGVGSHTIKVKDSKGCIKTISFSVTLLSVYPLVVSSVSGFIYCNTGTTTVTISASGGVPPYSGTGVFTVNAGPNTYTVTDAAGATASKTVTVTQPSVLNLTVATGSITTYGGSTTATITASGGSPAYTYKLNSGAYQSSNTFSNIAAGTHTITVKDVKGCTKVQSITITQPTPVFQIKLVSKSDISCIGANNGSIQVIGLYGTAPYKYRKNFGYYTTSNTFSNLSPGTYTITCKDATGATSSISVVIANSSLACKLAGKGITGQDQKEIALPAITDGFEVSVFPNPSSTQFSIIAKSNKEENVHITVLNITGQKVYENNSSRYKKIEFGNSFMPGTYFAKITQGNYVQVIKIIKTR